jgi:hypothetical protein
LAIFVIYRPFLEFRRYFRIIAHGVNVTIEATRIRRRRNEFFHALGERPALGDRRRRGSPSHK